MGTLKLCYVDHGFAHFTTQALSKQQGDDWNDAPYEYNAGEPYSFHITRRKEGDKTKPWELFKVAYEGDFRTPCNGHYNSPYSVQDINRKRVPWLASQEWCIEQVEIYAGTSLDEFIRLVKHAGGEVYLPIKNEQKVTT